MTRPCLVIESGLIPYQQALLAQERLVARRQSGQIPDVLWLLEHPHSYTIGRLTAKEHFPLTAVACRRRGVAVFEADRGGSVTYHGPGQLVVYPIIKLGPRPDLHQYLRQLEQAVIGCLAAYGLKARRRPGLTGVWVGTKKVASIGVKISRGVTKHGVAVNVSCDLAHFKRIRPCGLAPEVITSIERLLGRRPPSLPSIRRELALAFGRAFELELVFMRPRARGSDEIPEPVGRRSRHARVMAAIGG